MAQHDAAGASAAAEESAAGFEESESGATARGGSAGEEYFCYGALHVLRRRAAVQLPERRGDEWTAAGGCGDSWVRLRLKFAFGGIPRVVFQRVWKLLI